MFRVSSSPFLLNATIKHHFEKYKSTEAEVLKMFTWSIYIDDATYGAKDDNFIVLSPRR